MKKKEITLCGNQVMIAYCFATEIAFQKYTGVGLDKFESMNPEHVVYIILSAILAYYEGNGEESPVKDKDLMYNATPTELTNALVEIFALRSEWYDLPKGDDKPADKEGKEKNV